ncbi:anti-sigma B factor antagonist [Azonexus hydrophilus]|uniref:Anti-sigma B factor antagonist n=1 Tax=Azonexus hydrophilus TaxID=418702 RepID=A0A1R1I2K0_9RHOO|nr:STAS domain-containing protein [Azonexus hydrophilus]OMG52991.1 anti-sigma B factor antagonist [Azonexus hydrophilus]
MGTQNRLAITEDLTIYHAMEQKERLVAALEMADGLELDLSQVGEIDTAGLQLLILVKREAARRDKALSIVAHSPAVRQTLDFCNLAAFFGDPVVITAHEQR